MHAVALISRVVAAETSAAEEGENKEATVN
jgi:hypothetical protein